jgi:excinuclease ABC subunit B
MAYNEKHGITPTTVQKAIAGILSRHIEEERQVAETNIGVFKKSYNLLTPKDRKQLIAALNKEMIEHAKNLEFEQAAAIRDEIKKIEEMET